LPRRACDLSVDLPRPGAADADEQFTAGQVGQTAGTAPEQQVGGEPEPARPLPGGEDGYIQHAVIGPRVGQERDVALERADVADDHAAGPAPARRAAVCSQRHPGRAVAEMPQRGHRIGGPAQAFLQLLAGAREHLGVESDPGHDHERAAVGGPDVQPPIGSGQRYGQRLVHGQRQAEVAGEQIPGAARQHAKRDPRARHASRAGGDGPVAPAGQHQVNAGPHGFGGQPLTRVIRPGFQPERLGPAKAGHGLADDVPETIQVVVLAWMYHQRGAFHWPAAVTWAAETGP
jgi:hypothetical protein